MVLIDMSGRFTERMLPDVVDELWDLREAGRTGEEIAVLLGWKKSAVFAHLEEHGGIRPRWGRNLSGRSLTFEERQEIMLWKAQHLSIREIGRRLGRSHSTISRELRRNVMPRNGYRATAAHRIAFDAARHPRSGKLTSPGLLRDQVIAGLKGNLSPEQISGRLRIDYPTELSMRVSHETVYRALYSGSRNTLTRSAVSAVRTGRTARKQHRKATGRVGRIQNMTSIADRPAIAEDRSIPGAWEGEAPLGNNFAGDRRPQFDPDAFVRGTGTLYSLSKEGQGSAGALVTALTAAVVEAAEEYATGQAGGRLAVPMLVVLDEAANVCRWKNLPDLYSHYGSRGIPIMSLFQSWAQGQVVFGREGMRKLWSASNVKLYLGGVAEADFLRELSELVGDYDKSTASVSYNRGIRSTNHQLRRERILDSAELSALPRGRAVMLSSGTPAALIETVPWMKGKHAAAVRASIAAHDPSGTVLTAAARPAALPVATIPRESDQEHGK